MHQVATMDSGHAHDACVTAADDAARSNVLATLLPPAEQVLQAHLQALIPAQPAADKSDAAADWQHYGCPIASLPAWQLSQAALPPSCCSPDSKQYAQHVLQSSSQQAACAQVIRDQATLSAAQHTALVLAVRRGTWHVLPSVCA